jgi:serine phosphatase RsbU (regulator of sigma subunit)
MNDEARGKAVGLGALPDLLRALSPLRSMADPVALSRSVSEWIVATVATGCEVHLVDSGGLITLVDIRDSPPPGPVVVADVVASCEPQILEDALGDRAWIVLPLLAKAGCIGALSMLVACPAAGLGASHRRGLAAVASTLAGAISEAQAQQQAKHVSQARQASLLPGALPEADWLELSARYVPGTADLRIGGDWYDSQVMPDGTVALSVGDVAGHGIEAAAQMGELRSAMVALRLVRSAPDELISVVHRLASDMSYFATVVCARLGPTGKLQWASAGHLPPLVVHHNGETEVLGTDQSPPLGVGYAGRVPVNRYELTPGDTVLLYTDGLVERRGVDIAEGLEALAACAGAHHHEDVDQLIKDLVAQLEHPLSTGDDVAILAARWSGKLPTPRRSHVPQRNRPVRHPAE